MKAKAPIFCLTLAIGLTQNLSAQVSADDFGFDSGGGFADTTAAQPASARVREIRLDPGPLAIVVQTFSKQFEEAGENSDAPGLYQVPTIIWGPGAPEREIEPPLRLVNIGAADGLALIATAAGCELQPIHSPPQNGDLSESRIIGYRIVAIPKGEFTPAAAGVAAPFAVARVTAPTLPNFEVEAEEALSFTQDGNLFMVEAGAARSMPEQLVGIGVTLNEEDGKIVIGSVLPNSPAHRNGAVKKGMQLLGVAPLGGEAESIEGKNLAEVVGLIRGRDGTTVTLKLLGSDDSGEPISVSLGREVIPLPQPDFRVVTPPRVTVVDPRDGVVLNVGEGGRGNAASPQIVRVYALGAILRGNDEEMSEAEQALSELIEITLDLAELRGKDEPTISIHGNSKTLIVKATTAEHEIISQVIEAWKENQKTRKSGDASSVPVEPAGISESVEESASTN